VATVVTRAAAGRDGVNGATGVAWAGASRYAAVVRRVALAGVSLLMACTGSPGLRRDAQSEAPPTVVGGTVLIEDQTVAGATSGLAEASFPGGLLLPNAQGVVAGVTSTTSTYDQCVLALPPVCSPACAAGLQCIGPNSCAATTCPTPSLNAGMITITGAAVSPLVLTLQSTLALYSTGAPTKPLLALGETLHVAAPGAAFPAFQGDLAGIDDLAVTQPSFPTDGSPVPLPTSGGLAFTWSAPAGGAPDVLAIQLIVLGGPGGNDEALLDCRPADSAGAYTIPQAALDALNGAFAPSDAGTGTNQLIVRRSRDVVLATNGGAVHWVAASTVSAPFTP
jgi:hypothetical protein